MWLSDDADNSAQGKSFSAKVVVSAVQNLEDIKDIISPIIKLNGDSSIDIEQNTLFTDLGVSEVTDDKDQLDVSNIEKTYEYYDGNTTVTVNSVDTTRIGVYYIYYRVTDSEGNVGCNVRSVNVYKRENSIPNITLIGDSIVSIYKGDTYTELGINADDNEDGDLTNKVVTIGNVNTNVIGLYIIKYVVEDSDGNTASITRSIVVNKKGSISIDIGKTNLDNNIVSVPTTFSAVSGNVVGYYISDNNKAPTTKDYINANNSANFNHTFEIKKNGTYYIWGKDSNGNVISDSIEVTQIDSKKPVCTFGNIDYMTKGMHTDIELICTDESNVQLKYLINSDFDISDSTKASIEGVSGSTIIDHGYKYVITINAKALGEFNLSLKADKIFDFKNNGNDIISHKIIVSELNAENL